MVARGHDERAPAPAKIAHEVTGPITGRSASVYIPKKGVKEVAICTRCHLIHQNKRWYMDEAEARHLLADPHVHQGICPACRRMEDNVPGGS